MLKKFVSVFFLLVMIFAVYVQVSDVELGFLYKNKNTYNSVKKAPSAIIPKFVPPTLQISKIINLVNTNRESNKLNKLEINDELQKASMMKAKHLCENDYWSHISPDGVTPWDFFEDADFTYNTAGENLAKDFTNEQVLVSSWMSSLEHKNNILNKTYKYTGVSSYYCDEFMGYGTLIVVQLFASKQPINSYPTNNVVSDPNEAIHCNIDSKCGGGSIPLTRTECNQSTCCQMKDQSWVFYRSNSQCDEDQRNGK
jgi:uncharacterized protein YkwD